MQDGSSTTVPEVCRLSILPCGGSADKMPSYKDMTRYRNADAVILNQATWENSVINPHQLSAFLFKELHRHPIAALLQHLAFVALLAGYLVTQLTTGLFLSWLTIAMTGAIWQWLISQRYQRRTGTDIQNHQISSVSLAALGAGLSLGLTALLFPQLDAHTRIVIVLILTAAAAAGIFRHSAFPSIYLGFMLGTLLPTIVMLLFMSGDPDWQLIPALLLTICLLYYSAAQRRQDLMDDLISRFGLESDAGEDKLTHVANRRRFDQVLNEEWSRASRSGLPISLIMVDIDHFKKFNDHYGHQEGDRCLAIVAQALAESARRPTDFVARYGGEEFVIVLNQTPRNDAYQLAEQMRKRVEDLKIVNEDTALGQVTISLGGVTVFADPATSPETMVRLADDALYQVKTAGRNQVHWHHSTLTDANDS